ncbi:MAG: HAD-IA family hydrolase, partial [Clostridiales bacterium]|nr:HAD-IA family hydrolase [Clostridiales bacterium]
FEASRSNLIKERLDSLGVPKKEGLLETLQILKDMGFAMAVASSTKKTEVCRLLQNAGILSFFSAIIGGDSVSNSKPAPDPYIAAAHALGLEPCECFAVEDSKAGIKSANAAGCAVIMLHDLTAPDCETKALTVATAESLRELVEIIGELGKGSCFNEL